MNKKSAAKLSWLDRLFLALPKVPERAATLIDEGYRFVVDPDRKRGLLVHKPQSEKQIARLGFLQPYRVTVWKDELECKYRYRCTCPFFVGMVKNSELEPECKHGVAAVAEHEKRLAEYERALETVAWVEHIEGIAGPPPRPACTPQGRQARSAAHPDYVDRLVASSHFGISANQPGRYPHIGDIVFGEGEGYPNG